MSAAPLLNQTIAQASEVATRGSAVRTQLMLVASSGFAVPTEATPNGWDVTRLTRNEFDAVLSLIDEDTSPIHLPDANYDLDQLV